MSVICLADDSYEMSSIYSLKKMIGITVIIIIKDRISSATILLSSLRLKYFCSLDLVSVSTTLINRGLFDDYSRVVSSISPLKYMLSLKVSNVRVPTTSVVYGEIICQNHH